MVYYFSAVGKRHFEEGKENQDALTAFENERYALAVLADGVSSCERAQEGAQAACRTVEKLLRGNPDFFFSRPQRIIAQVALRYVMRALNKMADGGDAAAFSSTLAFALVDKQARKTLLFQLGDGLVTGCRGDRCFSLIQPDSDEGGTCVTTTLGAETRCRMRMLEGGDWNAFMLMTDGAWRECTDRGRMEKNITRAFALGEYVKIRQHLEQKEAQDDHSFVILKAG